MVLTIVGITTLGLIWWALSYITPGENAVFMPLIVPVIDFGYGLIYLGISWARGGVPFGLIPRSRMLKGEPADNDDMEIEYA